jgi:SecD/SecF fusion protein
MVVLALGIAAYFNGFDEGVEFSGGRSYTVKFEKKVDVEAIRDGLKTTFEGENPIIKTIGDNSTLDITTAYLIKDTRTSADSIVDNKLFTGLKGYLPDDMTFEQFETGANKLGKQGSKKVLPTISDDLKKGALNATLFAMLAIFIYIFIRFRDWR